MEREISLKELFDVIWKGKWIIGIAAVAAFVVAAAGGFIYDSTQSKVSTIVTMQWDGVADGEYPDGSRFEYSTAIQPHVITLALVEEELSYNANEVRNVMTLTPIVPSDVLTQIQVAIENGEELTYYATNYRLTLDNGSLGISVQESVDLINEIVEQFRADFERKYIHQMTILDFTDTDYDDYDYLDIYDILDVQVKAIESLMEPRSDVNFTSELGYTFNDILVRTDVLSRIELTQIITRTNNYLLTKDVDYLIANYKYKVEQAEFNLSKATAKGLEIQGLVTNYREINNILIPGLDVEGIEVDTYYSELVANLVELQNEIAELTYDIEYYELQISRLEGTDGDFNVTPQQQADEIVIVERNITDADDKLAVIVNDANILLVEYNTFLTSNVIKTLMAPEYQSSVSVVMISAIGLVLGAGIGAVVVLFKHDWN
ncbi:hypothetical protein KQ51_00720 [Candidatus Izimaplasma bacterium HR1]|jgi:capsular polysaccharide biosynthesis protein|uniref:hypothetical protein n=1 Tax=Candidatus Izimoplasma sp. HR1 TaxID=1541959 RepID=UPI0004F8BA7F|nr:hypothetical protein KQ51_00720 [Candidatus Izimaplasma bacterium HR1]